MKEDARKMVLTMVDMERSYLTADVFRDIISQNGAVDGADQPGLLRTLSGDFTPALPMPSIHLKRMQLVWPPHCRCIWTSCGFVY